MASLVAVACWSTALAACDDTEPSSVATRGVAGSTSLPDAAAPPSSSTTPPADRTTTIEPSVTAVDSTGAVIATMPSPTEGGRPCPNGELPAVGALELTSGSVLWTVCSSTETYRSMIGATEEVVLVRESHELDGHVIALDPDDGEELWRWQSPPAQRSPGSITGSGVVVLLTGDHDDAELVGVDALTGVERWRVAEPLTVLGSTDRVVGVKRFSDRRGTERIRGVARETGYELWESDVVENDMSGQYGSVAPSVIWGESLIVPTGTTTTAVDLETGAAEWTSPDVGTPLGVGDIVVGGGPLQGSDAMIHGVDPSTGRGAWSVPGRTAYGGYLAVGDGAVVANGDAGLVAYDQATGEERWSATDGFEPHGIADGKVLSLWEAALEARSTVDGVVVWQLTEPFGSPFMNNLATNSTAVFVAINSLPWGD